MRSPQLSAGIIPYFQKDGHYHFLCIKHQRGHRGFPKGGIEQHESEQETAIREFMEETGISEVKLDPKAKFIEHFPIINDGKQIEKTVTFFLGEIGESEISNIHVQSREMADYKVGIYEEIMKMLTYPEARETLREAFKTLTIHYE